MTHFRCPECYGASPAVLVAMLGWSCPWCGTPTQLAVAGQAQAGDGQGDEGADRGGETEDRSDEGDAGVKPEGSVGEV